VCGSEQFLPGLAGSLIASGRTVRFVAAQWRPHPRNSPFRTVAVPHVTIRSGAHCENKQNTARTRLPPMRLSLRFLIPLMLALAVFAWLAAPLSGTLMQRWFIRDLDMRSSLIASAVSE